MSPKPLVEYKLNLLSFYFTPTFKFLTNVLSEGVTKFKWISYKFISRIFFVKKSSFNIYLSLSEYHHHFMIPIYVFRIPSCSPNLHWEITQCTLDIRIMAIWVRTQLFHINQCDGMASFSLRQAMSGRDYQKIFRMPDFTSYYWDMIPSTLLWREKSRASLLSTFF